MFVGFGDIRIVGGWEVLQTLGRLGAKVNSILTRSKNSGNDGCTANRDVWRKPRDLNVRRVVQHKSSDGTEFLFRKTHIIGQALAFRAILPIHEFANPVDSEH